MDSRSQLPVLAAAMRPRSVRGYLAEPRQQRLGGLTHLGIVGGQRLGDDRASALTQHLAEPTHRGDTLRRIGRAQLLAQTPYLVGVRQRMSP